MKPETVEYLNNIARSFWTFSIKNPLLSFVAIVIILLFSLMISHVIDIKEGNLRNKFLWVIFIICVSAMVVIFLSAIDKGYILG